MDIPLGLDVERREGYRLGGSARGVWNPDHRQGLRFDRDLDFILLESVFKVAAQ
jgi:hypothetical protein